jgi:Ca2+-binding RTX toxin-like protein
MSYELWNGTAGDDNLNYAGANQLEAYGYGGNDYIWGNYQNDYIDASDGNDIIGGHTGADYLVGGLGGDTFFFGFQDGSIDTIADFYWGEGDKIEIQTSFGATSTSEFGYDANTGALSFNGTQFATLANVPSDFTPNLDIYLA